jgi:hypothetical protein
MNGLASLLILVAGLSFGFRTHLQGPSQTSASPEEAARSFYKWYLHALYQSPDAVPFEEQNAGAQKYVTVSLLQKLANAKAKAKRKERDIRIEYFFGTLDLDSNWENNIAVLKHVMKGATAEVEVTLGAREDNRRDLKVTMRKENGLWKIDSVNGWNL